jgi:hypothetical protein
MNYKNTEIWAQLYLNETDCKRIRDFFNNKIGIKSKYILRKMHLTVYYARRPLHGVIPLVEIANITISTYDTRFMVLAPGGENKRIDVIPSNNMVGIRIQKRFPQINSILNYRQKMISFETSNILGSRKKSTLKSNAFGARYFQPHLAILKPNNGISDDLSEIGNLFRNSLDFLHFDKFEIKIEHRENMLGLYNELKENK